MGEYFFTSDTHFGHENVIRHSNRPFESAIDMDARLIENWNKVVKPSDVVFHLGDFSFAQRERTLEIIHRLNGRIHLVLGNHDYRMGAKVKAKFESVSSLKEIKIEDQKITLCHYAMMVWNCSHYGAWMLHGHSHGTLPDDPYSLRMDVGVDPCGYRPISFAEVKALMGSQQYLPRDFHGKRN